MMKPDIDNCCGTTCDKQKTQAYIEMLEKNNEKLRRKCYSQGKVIQELLDTCEEMGLERRFDS